jgi:hypothetical protein
MEGNSSSGRILCSQKTADILIAAGKPHWISLRNDAVDVKGKGRMICYWCSPTTGGDNSVASRMSQKSLNHSHLDINADSYGLKDDATKRLVDWMTELFEKMLFEVLSNRQDFEDDASEVLSYSSFAFNSPRDEVSETIVIPRNHGNEKYRVKTVSKLPLLLFDNS